MNAYERSAERPFLLYLAYTMPHIPLAASPEFDGRSGQGLYADVVEELDTSVGHLSVRLAELGIDKRTYVFVTSDNGPWTGDADMAGGSAGELRGTKGTTWEGGVRIPLVAKGPGLPESGAALKGVASLLDLFPTVTALAGVPLPEDREMDGRDISPFLRGDRPAAERALVFSNRNKVNAIRQGPWKLHLRERPLDKRGIPQGSVRFEPPLLYRLDTDPGESADVSGENPEVVGRLRTTAEAFAEGMDPQLRLRPFGRAILRGLITPAP
ncbi:MAG: sulfatase-like hydrolase/transferase [Bryobacterales bacterium]|nr:sulfatase-like hydrolase/transferase [Bryobacterales bacterium]